jgi:hypothetical protein
MRCHLKPFALLTAWLLAWIVFVADAPSQALAASMTTKDVQILAKVIGFLEPAPSGVVTVAVAYDPGNTDSRKDAEAIAAYFGDGLKAGAAFLKPQLVEVGQLATGGFVAVIAASAVKIDQVFAATKALHIACVTADADAVQIGQCLMSVKSVPKVEILLNRSAASISGVSFGSAFLLMAHEV